jgi:hypothetical protein
MSLLLLLSNILKRNLIAFAKQRNPNISDISNTKKDFYIYKLKSDLSMAWPGLAWPGLPEIFTELDFKNLRKALKICYIC